MRKIRLFIFTFVFVLCGAVLLSGCDKDDESEIVAVDPTVNVYISNGQIFKTNNRVSDASIQTSYGDTEGTVVWETPDAYIQLGTNDYSWIFTPSDTKRYNTVTGTLKITGEETYELDLAIDSWTYGESPCTPSVIGYEGNSSDLSITYMYYNSENKLMTSSPATFDAGEYTVRAKITILNAFEVEIWKEFEIESLLIDDFELSINNWGYGEYKQIPQVRADLVGYVKFSYSNSENGTYTQTVPEDAGTYYVKAEISGTNNFYGESEPVEFRIEKAYRTGIYILIDSINYGEELVPARLSVENLGNVVFKYTVRGSDDWTSNLPSQAGNYEVKVIIPESNNYKETEFSKEFKISRIDLTEEIEDIEGATYTGSSQVPNFEIDGLSLETDYQVSWKWKNLVSDDSYYIPLNTDANNFVLAGYYKATITGLNYNINQDKIYKIDAAELPGVIGGLEEATYTGTSLRPNAIIKGLVEHVDYNLNYEYKKIGAPDSEYTVLDEATNNFVNAGVYKVTATGMYNYSGSITETYTIVKSSSKTHGDITDVEYSENLTVPSISLESGWVWDTQDENYNVALNVGDNIRVAVFSDDNYYAKVNVKIVVVDSSVISVESLEDFKSAIENNDINTINVDGDITINEDLSIERAITIVVNQDCTLTIDEGTTLTIVDGVVINGNLVKSGTLALVTTNINNISANVDQIVLRDLVEDAEIDLNNNTLNVKLVIEKDGDNTLNLTIKNGTISSSTNGIEINANKNCTITLENLTVSAGDYALYTVTGTSGASISTNGCQFTGTDIGAMLLANYTYSFTYTNFSGVNGMYVNAGEINLIGGIIIGSGELVETPSDDITPTGHALFINSNNSDGSSISMHIEETTFAYENGETVYIKECGVGEGSAAEVSIDIDSTDLTGDNIEKENATVCIDGDEI